MSTVPSQLRSLLRVIRSCPYSRSMLVGPIMATILGLGVMPHLRGPTPPLADCPESVYDPYAQKMCCLSVVTVVYLRAMPLPLPRHSEVSGLIDTVCTTVDVCYSPLTLHLSLGSVGGGVGVSHTPSCQNLLRPRRKWAKSWKY